MTKKDYQAIAGAIYSERKYRGADMTVDDVVRVVAKVMAEDNPRFSRERFEEACSTGKCRGMRQAS